MCVLIGESDGASKLHGIAEELYFLLATGPGRKEGIRVEFDMMR